MAGHLEMKARIASKLAKLESVNSSELYALKNSGLKRLFGLPGYMPFIRDAWATKRGILLSLKLSRTDSWLHFPFDELNASAQQFYGPWVAKRARGNPWHPPCKAPLAQGAR